MSNKFLSQSEWAAEAARVMQHASRAISETSERISEAIWIEAVELLLGCTGKLVVTGVGKSGAVGKKLASTFASTGTVAVYMHPSEALHGDLGILTANDVVLAISYSGETDELIGILPSLCGLGIPVISMTSSQRSSLGRISHVVLDISIDGEACPMKLAPTTSTSVMLATGDALALTTMQARGFTRADYALLHPSGALGRRLTVRVSDIMRTGTSVAIVDEDTTLIDTVLKITNAHAGAAIVVNASGTISGLVTDGDIRRHLLSGERVLRMPTRDIMNPNPGVVAPDILAADALVKLGEFHPDPGTRVGEAPVAGPDHRPLGMLMLKDIVQSGIGG